jgi:3-methyladenine DNA glycosylase AlkD
MTLKQAMAALEKMGTAQNRKVYARHGAGENMFGVSFANLNALKKQIGTDHDLAEQLWQTGNVDAMSLATMIADPDAFTASSADAWLRQVDYAVLGGLLAGVIARSSLAPLKIAKWTRSKQEFTRQAGYDLLCGMLKESPDALGDVDCRNYLQTIKEQIHASPNLARHAMNAAVIAIGIYKPSLRQTAIETAGRIGKVEVDHGETGCKTPDAIAYINNAAARQKTKSTGRKSPSKRARA